MQDVKKTIQKLRALAEGDGNEAETAKMILGQLLKEHPEAEAGPARSVINEIWIPTKSKHRHELTASLAMYLGCTLKAYKKTPMRGLFVRGDAAVLASFPAVLKQLQTRLEKILDKVCLGFVLGALPMPDDGLSTKTKNDTESRLSAEELQAAMMGAEVGRKATPRLALPAAALPG